MHAQLPGVILALASLAATGCGTCVSIEATYDEAWRAARAAMLAQPEMRSVAAPFEHRYDAGNLEATVMRPDLHDELHYHVEVRPAGGEDGAPRTICVWVQQVDAPVSVGGDELGKVQSRRRRDLEAAVTGHIERAFADPDDVEQE